MSILWYPSAIKRPGPASKIRDGKNTASGVVMHSAEGWAGGNWFEITRPDRQSGWHFFNRTDGVLEQHYPLDAIVTNAGAWANANLIAIENEGMAGTPLTEAQVESSRKFIYWLAADRGWQVERLKTLFGHNDPGVMGAATQCPSGRIPWAQYKSTGDTYIVQRGDSLGVIAGRFRLSLADLTKWNNITNPDRIEVGQVLRLTAPDVEPQPLPAPPPFDRAKALEMARANELGALAVYKQSELNWHQASDLRRKLEEVK